MKESDIVFGIERSTPDEGFGGLRMYKLVSRGNGDYEYVPSDDKTLQNATGVTLRRAGYDVTYFDDTLVVDIPDRGLLDVGYLSEEDMDNFIAFSEEARKLKLKYDLQKVAESYNDLMEEEEKKERQEGIVVSGTPPRGRVCLGWDIEATGLFGALREHQFSQDVWLFEDLKLSKGRPDNDSWQQSKIKKGRGHNKFKRGKKK